VKKTRERRVKREHRSIDCPTPLASEDIACKRAESFLPSQSLRKIQKKPKVGIGLRIDEPYFQKPQEEIFMDDNG
jgi:hypothetical protein